VKNYIRDLEDGTIQRAVFADDPGVSTPQWRLDETPRNNSIKQVVNVVKKPRKKAKK
tara:strand:+ start:512 stop:682 length:171 start_codon:yes stop_codon:yes gene_type:complete